MRTKADRDALVTLVNAFMEVMRAKDAGWRLAVEWEIETTLGPLRVFPQSVASGVWVFARFKEPKRARKGGVCCNEFTGKWNHHYGCSFTPESAFADFKSKLEPLLVTVAKA